MNLTVRSVLLLNPENEGVVIVEANYAAVEGRGRERILAVRNFLFPMPVAEKGSIVSEVGESR